MHPGSRRTGFFPHLRASRAAQDGTGSAPYPLQWRKRKKDMLHITSLDARKKKGSRPAARLCGMHRKKKKKGGRLLQVLALK